MIQNTMLIILLAVVLLGFTSPEVTIAHVHPTTPILFLAAACGFWLVYRSRTLPMWEPTHTSATVKDVPDQEIQVEAWGDS